MAMDVAESITIHKGLSFTLSFDYLQFLVESDSLSVVSKINNSDHDLSDLGLVVADIKYLGLSFSFIKFSFIPKQAIFF